MPCWRGCTKGRSRHGTICASSPHNSFPAGCLAPRAARALQRCGEQDHPAGSRHDHIPAASATTHLPSTISPPLPLPPTPRRRRALRTGASPHLADIRVHESSSPVGADSNDSGSDSAGGARDNRYTFRISALGDLAAPSRPLSATGDSQRRPWHVVGLISVGSRRESDAGRWG